jgi:hypothetical protein
MDQDIKCYWHSSNLEYALMPFRSLYLKVNHYCVTRDLGCSAIFVLLKLLIEIKSIQWAFLCLASSAQYCDLEIYSCCRYGCLILLLLHSSLLYECIRMYLSIQLWIDIQMFSRMLLSFSHRSRTTNEGIPFAKCMGGAVV